MKILLHSKYAVRFLQITEQEARKLIDGSEVDTTLIQDLCRKAGTADYYVKVSKWDGTYQGR